MTRIGTFFAASAVALAATVTAAPAPGAATNGEKRPWEMSVEELAAIQIAPSARLRVKTLFPAATASAAGVEGADLIVPEPLTESGFASGADAGFPNASFPGWVVDLWVKNQGNRVSGATDLKIDCEVTVMPPGSPQYTYLKARWCAAFAASSGVPSLAGGSSTFTTPYRMFLGGPLWPCSYTDFPRPRVTVTVNSTEAVPESDAGEANNVRVMEFCLPD